MAQVQKRIVHPEGRLDSATEEIAQVAKELGEDCLAVEARPGLQQLEAGPPPGMSASPGGSTLPELPCELRTLARMGNLRWDEEPGILAVLLLVVGAALLAAGPCPRPNFSR